MLISSSSFETASFETARKALPTLRVGESMPGATDPSFRRRRATHASGCSHEPVPGWDGRSLPCPDPLPGRVSESVLGAPSAAGDRSHPALSGFGQTCSVSTILFVDDEPAVRDALERALKAQHYTVATAADGRQALDAIAEQGPDLVLLDV